MATARRSVNTPIRAGYGLVTRVSPGRDGTVMTHGQPVGGVVESISPGSGGAPGRPGCRVEPSRRGPAGPLGELVPVMELRQIKKRSLVERLVAEVRGQITAGRLAEGQQLPTEARMAAGVGGSRPPLREALGELRAEGFVETVNGRGTFVRHPSEADLADAFVRQLQLSGDPELTADHLYEARQGSELCSAARQPMELCWAARAAERATPELIATLERLLQAMEDSGGDAASYTAADVGFHVTVARATENPLFPALLAPIATIIIRGMFSSHGHPDAVRLGIEAHRKVLTAIKRGQPEAARRAMAAPLRESCSIFPDRAIRSPRG